MARPSPASLNSLHLPKQAQPPPSTTTTHVTATPPSAPPPSPDTIVPGVGDPQAWNRYAYVLGNPLRYTDPSGHCGVDVVFDIGFALWSGWDLIRSPSLANLGWFAGDVGGIAVPCAAGLGRAAKIVSRADEPTDAVVATKKSKPARDPWTLKSPTRRNFQENLRRQLRLSHEAIRGLEAHHVLPNAFSEQWAKIFSPGSGGIHNPKYGVFIHAPDHRRLGSKYNELWTQWFKDRRGSVTTVQEVESFAKQLATEFGYGGKLGF